MVSSVNDEGFGGTTRRSGGISVTLFADFTSAASYLTEALLWPRAAEGEFDVSYRACPSSGGAADHLDDGMLAQAETLGLTLGTPRLRPDARKANELALFARGAGLEATLRQALYRAYWQDGADIGRIDVLQALAAGLGLDELDVKIALDLDRFRAEVLRDEAFATRLGIRRPPVLYVGTGPGAGIIAGLATAAALDAELSRGGPGDRLRGEATNG